MKILIKSFNSMKVFRNSDFLLIFYFNDTLLSIIFGLSKIFNTLKSVAPYDR